jgi:phosphate/sulfate permease
MFAALVIAGFTIGGLTTYRVYESMVSLSGARLAYNPLEALTIAFSVLALMFLFTLTRLPASITHVIVGGWVGGSLALGAGVNLELLAVMVLAWLASPIAAMLIVYVAYSVIVRSVSGFIFTNT